MRYISIFSGIEAASVAWKHLGWELVALAEIEPFPCALLKQRFSGVPNLGDVKQIDWSEYAGKIDLIVGGSPCQSFSVAGNREGLSGESGLMFEYIRAVRDVMPRYFIWENVPGALSSEKGEAFGQLLREMDELGYGLAWRVLDAQFFRVSQRRRRVFLVGCLGDPTRAAEVLFERESLRWDTPSSAEQRKTLAVHARVCALGSHPNPSGKDDGGADRQGSEPVRGEGRKAASAYSLQVRCGCAGGGKGALIQDDLSATLSTSSVQTVFQPVEPECYYLQGNMIGRDDKNGPQGDGINEEVAYTLNTTDRHAVAYLPSMAYAISGNIIGRDGKNGGNHLGIEDDGAMFTLTTADRHAVAFSWNQDVGFSTADELAPTLRAAHSGEPAVCMASGQTNAETIEECCPTQASRQHKDPPIVALSNGDDVCGALCARDYKGVGNQYVTEGKLVCTEYAVRRLMPVECERLQGFPDGWTDLGGTSDAPRYKALGNSMAVPVMRWIGERIAQAERNKQNANNADNSKL